MKQIKTNVMRILDAEKIPYESRQFKIKGEVPSGDEMAKILEEDPNHVFKTLVTVANSGEHYVFMVPVNVELDLKKAAKVVGEKKIEMIKMKDLLKLTGYVHGGCSPIGMKKDFPTYIHETCLNFPKILFSAGKVGVQIVLDPRDLLKLKHIKSVNIAC